MKANFDGDAESGFLHTEGGKTGNVNDALEGNNLLHEQEIDANGEAGFQGIYKHPDATPRVTCHVTKRLTNAERLKRVK